MSFKIIIASLILGLTLGVDLLAAPAAKAAPLHPIVASFQSDACGTLSSNGFGSCSSGGSTISKLMNTAINILSIIAGFAGIIMIIVSGVRFITAQGDSSSIASARTALIYALVGLVVAALAQVIVHFVFGKVTKGT